MNIREEFVKLPVFDEKLPLKVELAGISYCDGTYKIERKKSDIMCIEYIISGCGTVKTMGKTFYPKQGDSYFLLPGEEHLYYSDSEDPWVKIWINVSGSIVETLVDAYRMRDMTVVRCNSMPYIEKIHSLMEDESLSPKEIADRSAIYFHELLQFLANSKEKDAPGPAEIVKNYIDKNVYSPITIDELSKLIYKSDAQTIRIFKKQYGVTPYDYYMESRIKKAVQMLENTSFSVKEIAFRLGFGDEHYFSGIFKKKTGKKPTDFR